MLLVIVCVFRLQNYLFARYNFKFYTGALLLAGTGRITRVVYTLTSRRISNRFPPENPKLPLQEERPRFPPGMWRRRRAQAITCCSNP